MSKLDGLYSGLNLDGGVPERAKAKTFRRRNREWGPERVPSTFMKKLMRVLVPIGFVIMAAVVIFVGYQFFMALKG
ncbi:hypothetical protein [Propionicicella superfundia]|uniref:hypothetical protein n=1 Tax=Propionicicella superfundia TaxID=348582 RepID=UPI000402543E|nr:hypothetical protein [Propionicicella superfundia]